MNAFRGVTCDELIHALTRAGYDREIGVIVLAGAGDRAFCTGGGQAGPGGQDHGRGTVGWAGGGCPRPGSAPAGTAATPRACRGRSRRESCTASRVSS